MISTARLSKRSGSLALQRALKRLIDAALSFASLVVLSPLLGGIGLAVKLTSRGPMFYAWEVAGKNGSPFTAYKFRTMIQGADGLKASLLTDNEMQGPVFKMRRDPRVTPLGRFLRRYSLDELPQLWSVLKGDMSLVGPRPPLQSEYARFSEWQRRKLSVTPGITCLWQIRGRNTICDFDEWVRLDIEYIEKWSLWLDLQILARTVPAVLSARGAS